MFLQPNSEYIHKLQYMVLILILYTQKCPWALDVPSRKSHNIAFEM